MMLDNNTSVIPESMQQYGLKSRSSSQCPVHDSAIHTLTNAHDKMSVVCTLKLYFLSQLEPASICIMLPSIPPMPPCCRAPNHNSSIRSSIVLNVGSRCRVGAYSLRRILIKFRLECLSKACKNNPGLNRRLQRVTESRGQSSMHISAQKSSRPYETLSGVWLK